MSMETPKQAFAKHPVPLGHDDVIRFDSVLSDLQGNILRSNARYYSNYVFLSLLKGAEGKVREWIKRTGGTVTTAKQQLPRPDSTSSDREEKHAHPPTAALLLSAKGYQYLGLDTTGFSKSFVDGLRAARADISGNPINWEDSYRRDIHVLCILADNDQNRLGDRTRELVKEVQIFTADEPIVEHGLWKWQPDLKDTDRIEHFGYLDGRSNPVFFAAELQKQGKGAFQHWDSGAGPNLVCVPDPLGTDNGCGSYFVFQKLEQNVWGFFETRKQLASYLNVDERLAGAFMVGRFEEGEPLVTTATPSPAPPPIPFNDFDYSGNARFRCPVFSHIRKVNPRGTSTDLDPRTNQKETLEVERSHRIARRGIPYGKRNSGGEKPESGVGLLFFCCQADIKNQFEVMQGKWANESYFPQDGSGLDPLIGQIIPPKEGEKEQFPAQAWPTTHGGLPLKRKEISGMVRIKGGEYFFAPSLGFFKNL